MHIYIGSGALRQRVLEEYIQYRLFRSSGEMALVPDFFNAKSVFCVEDFARSR